MIAETAQPRSYLMNTGSNPLRRNRVHLKSDPNKGLGVEHETTHSEVTIAPRAEIHSEVPASPLPVIPTRPLEGVHDRIVALYPGGLI